MEKRTVLGFEKVETTNCHDWKKIENDAFYFLDRSRKEIFPRFDPLDQQRVEKIKTLFISTDQ